MDYSNAAKHFSVPRTTLCRLCQKNELSLKEVASTKQEKKSV